MKLRLVEPGWEGYTGNFGGVEFVDGLSLDDLSNREAITLGNIVRCELEDGTNPSASQDNLDRKCVEMVVRADMAGVAGAVEGKPNAKSREELEAIANKGGIKGLREIGDPLGVKAASIADLITAIIDAQGAAVVAEAPEAEVVAPADEAEKQDATE